MAEKIVATLTRADFPETVHYRGRCAEPGCTETEHEYYAERPVLGDAHMRGWFRAHVIETGHAVVIEEITLAPAPIGSGDCRP